MIEFLSIYWPPIVGALGLVYMFWNIHRTANDPDFIAMQQKAAYDTAHAYTKGNCCCGRNKD